MIFKIEFSVYAVQSYDTLIEQLEFRWGSKVVDDFEERTKLVLRSIQTSPFMFQAIENDENVRKAVIHSNCSVLYEVKNSKIEILLFLDNRQDPII